MNSGLAAGWSVVTVSLILKTAVQSFCLCIRLNAGSIHFYSLDSMKLDCGFQILLVIVVVDL